MKTICSVVLLVIAATVSTVFAAGLTSLNTIPVQQIVPKASKSTCTTLLKGRATSRTVNVASTSAINWDARIDNTAAAIGTADPLKIKYVTASGTNSNYIPNEGAGSDVKIHPLTTGFVFERYSSGKTATLCYELN